MALNRIRLDPDSLLAREDTASVLCLFCLKGRAILHADDTCFELQKEDAAYLSIAEALEIETEQTNADFVCFSLSADEEPCVLYAPCEIARNAPRLREKGYPGRGSCLCWDETEAGVARRLLMGFFRATGPKDVDWPSALRVETRERICFVYEAQEQGLFFLPEDGDQGPETEKRVLNREDALILPQGAPCPRLWTEGPYAIVWAAPIVPSRPGTDEPPEAP